jgi:4-diphosphocytidyl-2-C-methyl-D-erythritol kinase
VSAGSGVRARVLAPCKLNPTLVVIERRADGFHEVALSYLALDLADRVDLTLRAEPGIGLEVEGPALAPDVPADETNLAFRAARAVLRLAQADGRATADAGLALRLSKHVPSRAGLGGGSSDAAAAALAACLLLGLAPEDPRVGVALAQLGSDCAFFLAARASGHALGRGRGERVEALPVHAARPWIALATPAVGASTAAVYAALGPLGDPALNRARALDAERAWLRAGTSGELRAALVNDLEAAALRAVPELSRWREILDASGHAHFRLAGSGSSFFGIFDSERDARAASTSLARHAAARGLAARGAWVVRPAGHGALASD